ncbi:MULTISPECIES: alpha/beta hydrolase family protein [Alphaproteobacteria]|uniref:Alpha/beta hydrolase n=2 Tax=Alphaproteobacteria TaxID=28211 RepID=A0A512HCE5_9HYPH|nr:MULTISPECIES: hypothetical protein [Alphaproteobacteria]GEO83128.1 alpha/beta hydrolase [Ciceribacter naphthalenivorans]GLR20477.1 alpha/beta hydrolase [Ciceribacter naphthalenivorans]GLT03333.1 alpha/beta hydrolase [Sphingomonas psychrolutea]
MQDRVGVAREDVTFVAKDGFPLAGTLFQGTGRGPLALISSAAAVPRGIYARFAEHLVAERGFRAALTYDYRGVAESRIPRDFKEKPRMADWAERDMPAAIDRLASEAPGHRMVGVGQSFGGQALGLCGRADRFERYLMVAVMSGHWAYTNEPYKVFASMNLIGVPLALLTGRVPGWTGLGQTLPGTVFRQWARWGRSPDYFFADRKMDAARRFAEVRTPILSIGVEDDAWGTPKAQEAILKAYVNAPVERISVSPAITGRPIGHLGFFRPAFRDSLWQPAIDWLTAF